jgi:hypothetical protein
MANILFNSKKQKIKNLVAVDKWRNISSNICISESWRSPRVPGGKEVEIKYGINIATLMKVLIQIV